MSNLSDALISISNRHKLSNLQLAARLGVIPAVASRLVNDLQPVGHGTVARLTLTLNDDEARALLQAYFSDELQRIQESRIEKASELGIKLKDTEFSYSVRVTPTLVKAGATRVKRKREK